MSNLSRFSGFADLYDAVRPAPPAALGPILCAYADRARPDVVDIGSGSGLSSRWAAGWAASVVGVEPNDDMRAVAVAQPRPGVSYRNGTAQETRLPATSAEVVLAVQALHWMEPAPTFMEIARLLRPGGVFAAADADWPPVMASAAAERAWVEVERRIGVFEDRIVRAGALHDALAPAPRSVATSDVAPPPEIQARGGGVHSWKKAGHLARMAGSGLFSFVRELVFFEPVGTGTQGADAERFVALMRSQGSYQQLRRAGVGDDELGMDDLERAVADDLARGQGTEYGLLGLSWRVRIGVMA